MRLQSMKRIALLYSSLRYLKFPVAQLACLESHDFIWTILKNLQSHDESIFIIKWFLKTALSVDCLFFTFSPIHTSIDNRYPFLCFREELILAGRLISTHFRFQWWLVLDRRNTSYSGNFPDTGVLALPALHRYSMRRIGLLYNILHCLKSSGTTGQFWTTPLTKMTHANILE